MRPCFVILFPVLACLASADMVNITTCFCRDKYPLDNTNEEHTDTGTYFDFDYENFHLGQVFSINVKTHTLGAVQWDFTPPAQPYMPRTCAYLALNRQLCYSREKSQHRGRIEFNGHKRALPFMSTHRHDEHKERAMATCAERCVNGLGLAIVDRGRSNFASYYFHNICWHDFPADCSFHTYPETFLVPPE